MGKKGMVQGQTIMYVMGMIVVASILIFGFKSINSFRQQGEDMQLIKFKQTIVDSVSDIAQEYNSVEPVDVRGVSGVRKLCFASDASQVPSKYFLIKDSMSSDAKDNAFLVSEGEMQDSFYAGKIEVVGGFRCFNSTGGRISFTLKGLGDKVEITY
ncbi:MAG: hypothetical protein R6V50_07585 [Thermoplasmatota archaeon]